MCTMENTRAASLSELLFFDTFAHDNTEEINLDLVQFPKPVYVTEVRIIPLGARVQADFPGGVRLGATNPTQFKIDFFVNDLGKPGASTFETLGGFEYNQNGCINLECANDENVRMIPTDGLVLKGWYTTITLAVYGTLTKNIAEQIIQPPVNPPVVPSQPEPQPTTLNSGSEWTPEVVTVPLDYEQTHSYPQNYAQSDVYHPAEYQDYYNDAPKDPRNYHLEHPEWNKVCSRPVEPERERELYKPSADREHRSDTDKRDREREKGYGGRDRDRQPREYRGSPRDIDHDRGTDRDSGRSRSSYKHDDTSCRRSSYGSRSEDTKEREERKRPRTPPMAATASTEPSPKRPRTPTDASANNEKPTAPPNDRERKVTKGSVGAVEDKPSNESDESLTSKKLDAEVFEPILSDEDIPDDNEQYPDGQDDCPEFFGDGEDPIKMFVPGVTELASTSLDGQKDDNVPESLRIAIGICDDYFKSSIARYQPDNFAQLNGEIKEEFIHLCEKLPSIFGDVKKFVEIARIHSAIVAGKKGDEELNEQIVYVMTSTIDWLRIALDYELANAQDQPIYKIRHIKCGLKMAQFCFESDAFVDRLSEQKGFDVYRVLLDLYRREYMAPSIKLMILKALDSTLYHKNSIERFLKPKDDRPEVQNGFGKHHDESNYRALLDHLKNNSSVRLKFSLCSIVKKINLYEIFGRFRDIVRKCAISDYEPNAGDVDLLANCLARLSRYLKNGQFVLTQPKRFLPVSSQFEIAKDDSKNVVVEYFKIFDFIRCLAFLLTHATLSRVPKVKTPALEIVRSLSENADGVRYLASDCDAVNVVVKSLVKNDEEIQYSIQNGIALESHSLGLRLAYKMPAYHHLERIRNDSDDDLHALFCLALQIDGKIAVAKILADNFDVLWRFVNLKDKPDVQLKKSPSVLYVIDLVHIVLSLSSDVGLLEKYVKEISFLKTFEDQPDVCQIKLNAIASYLLPMQQLSPSTISYDNISPIVELLRKEADNIIDRPETATTCLRMLHRLGVDERRDDADDDHYVELKYKHVVLQLFSLDGVSLLVGILQKICDHYRQPAVHASTFVSPQGLAILELVSPSVLLLNRMLAYAIRCRNTNFKDLTAVPVLLRVYDLMLSYPMEFAERARCTEVREIVIDTLLVYTQPVSDEVNEKDSLNKTLWSMMCKEVIQFVSHSPHTFVPGLLVFSELLPLPLPVQRTCEEELDEKDASWMINLRRLWAAHLHPHGTLVQDIVNKLCTTADHQLLNLLRRICVQIGDLAANSALIVARGILDAVLDEAASAQTEGSSELRLARLLNFVACLTTHNALKCAVLSLIQNESVAPADQKYASLVTVFAQTLRTNDQQNSHRVQCQEWTLNVIQSFCDVEIALLQDPQGLSSDVYLSNALPAKDLLISFIDIICEYLSGNNSFVTYLPAVRTILLLTEHDYGFYHLRDTMSKKSGLFVVVLSKLSKTFAKDNADSVSLLNTLMEFFSVITVIEELVEPLSYTPRSTKINVEELKELVGWKKDGPHPLEVLKDSLKVSSTEDANFEGLHEKLTGLIALLQNDQTAPQPIDPPPEPLLPNPEPLLVQFSRRIICNRSDVFNERLTASYWLSKPLNVETEAEVENVTADIAEMCKQSFSDEYDLTGEIEIMCRISSASFPEKEKKTDEQKTKKQSVSPLRARGFPRMVQQRTDLFRSRPPNTSRPPSLHVDDFVALETCGAQPTGPTGYNKISREMIASRNPRNSRGRALGTTERSVQYRQMSWWGSGFGRIFY